MKENFVPRVFLKLKNISSNIDTPVTKKESDATTNSGDCEFIPNIDRFGGTLKFAKLIDKNPIEYLENLGIHKLVIGVSDYGKNANRAYAQKTAMKIKKILNRKGFSTRVLQNAEPALSTATCHHNQLGEKLGHFEILLVGKEAYLGVGVQNITAYKERDQARPFRDAKVGMLPPKLAQIMINLTGPLPARSTIYDPFCGTGVVLQEAALMGHDVLGTDLNPRMVEYTEKNLSWLEKEQRFTEQILQNRGEIISELESVQSRISNSRTTQKASNSAKTITLFNKHFEQGDATKIQFANFPKTPDVVVCETYLGAPMSTAPAEIKLRTEKQNCKTIVLGFLKNFAGQLKSKTPLVIAVPAWLREDGHYERLNLLDEIADLGYNVANNESGKGLLYFREGQVVAREIIVLRKK